MKMIMKIEKQSTSVLNHRNANIDLAVIQLMKKIFKFLIRLLNEFLSKLFLNLHTQATKTRVSSEGNFCWF